MVGGIDTGYKEDIELLHPQSQVDLPIQEHKVHFEVKLVNHNKPVSLIIQQETPSYYIVCGKASKFSFDAIFIDYRIFNFDKVTF